MLLRTLPSIVQCKRIAYLNCSHTTHAETKGQWHDFPPPKLRTEISLGKVYTAILTNLPLLMKHKTASIPNMVLDAMVAVLNLVNPANPN